MNSDSPLNEPTQCPAPIECHSTKDICRPMTLTERLTSRRQRLAAELYDVDNALNSLKNNPEISVALDNITRVFGESLR